MSECVIIGEYINLPGKIIFTTRLSGLFPVIFLQNLRGTDKYVSAENCN